MRKTLISPLFIIPFYSHTYEEYCKLRKMERERLTNFLRRDQPSKEWWEKNPSKLENLTLAEAERKYPTPLWCNDIAGFIAIKVENPVEGYRVIAEVWAIESRRFRTHRVLDMVYGKQKIIDKELLSEVEAFNSLFFNKIEELIDEIKNEFFNKKHFYLSLEDLPFQWELLKTMNVSDFIRELGPNWAY